MSIKIQIPKGVEPIPGHIFVMPVETLTSAAKSLITEVRLEIEPWQPAVVLMTNPTDTDDQIHQGDTIYYSSHAASGVEVDGQQFLTVPRSAVMGKLDV